jgi:hypothetical protein
VLRHTGGDPGDGRSLVVMRILGAREVAQAAVTALSPTESVFTLGAWVDLSHALTAVGLAAVSRRYRQPAMANAAIAAGWAGAGLVRSASGSQHR